MLFSKAQLLFVDGRVIIIAGDYGFACGEILFEGVAVIPGVVGIFTGAFEPLIGLYGLIIDVAVVDHP